MTEMICGYRLKSRCRGLVIGFLVFLVANASPYGSLLLSVQAACLAEDFENAQGFFELAEYAESLTRVDELLQCDDLPKGLLRDSYALRGRNLLAMGRTQDAQDAFCNAINTDRSWRPDPIVWKTDEIEAFNQTLETCEPPKKGKSKTLWLIAGGVVVGAVAVALLAGGGEEETDPPGELAGYPPPPN